MLIRNRAVFAPDGGGAGGDGGGSAAPGGDGGAAFDWGGALGDKVGEFQPLLQTKGWKTPADALAAYKNLEGLSGRMVAPPSADAKPEELTQIWDKLGRPKDPDGYAVARPTDLPADVLPDDDLADFRKAAHAAGLVGPQAKAMFDWFAGRRASEFKSLQEADAKVEPDLRGAWGANYDANVAVAQRAAKAFGGDAVFNLLERKIGGAEMVKLFHRIGAAMGEDTLAGNGGGSTGAPATAEAARQEITKLSGDKEFQAKLFDRNAAGHAEAKRQWNALHQKAYS